MTPEDRSDPSIGESSASETDQTLADGDQTASDTDQAAAESDRASSRSDRDGADRDQRASDREQAVADVEQRRHHGGPDSERTYDEARAERIDATADRGETAAERDAVDLARGRDAVRRDRTATLRDLTAVERDRAGDVRDRAAERESDALAEGAGAGDAAVEEFLAESARIRVRASADRARAAVDRGQAATDRAQAAADRRRARIAFQEAQYETLTGVYAHDLGRAALQLEMDDSRRDHRPFVLASIEVEGFDDYRRRRGDAAADALLVAVVDALNSSLVVSDPIVRTRVGEFLCGFAATDLDAALRRVEDICHSLEQGPTGGKVIVGLACLRPEETLQDLIARAGADKLGQDRPEEAR